MNFSDLFFIAYFLPLAIALYFACSFFRVAQNICLLGLSLVFYAWGSPLHLIPMVYLIVVNYMLGSMVGADKTVRQRKRIIALSVVLNLLPLVLLRYGADLAEAIGVGVWPQPPIGVAFFTLQAMAYVFDLSRGKARPDRNILNVGLYITFFPTVLFGPILRYGDLVAQIKNRRTSLEKLGQGSLRFATGLAKLVLVAYPIGMVAEHAFNMTASGNQVFDVPVMLSWLGVIAFSLKIYLAFSAFSDMAIGLAGIFGFTLKENFNYPYTVLTVTDFWKCWHISLFRWFYKYVYLALGASRLKLVRRRGAIVRRNLIVPNLLLLWTLIGLWHGLSWNYLLWGMWFFVFYVFEWIVRLPYRNIKNPAWRIYLLLAVCLSWVLFRCHSLNESLNYFANLLGLTGNGFYSDLAMLLLKENWLPLALGVILCTPLGRLPQNWLAAESGVLRDLLAVLYVMGVAVIFILSLIYLNRTGPMPLPFIF